MADTKKNTAVAAALVAAFAAGAGADRLSITPLETSVRPVSLTIAKDGYGLIVQVKAGAADATRILNWDRNGGAPLLDGQVFNNNDAREIGTAAALFAKTAEEKTANLTDELVWTSSKLK